MSAPEQPTSEQVAASEQGLSAAEAAVAAVLIGLLAKQAAPGTPLPSAARLVDALGRTSLDVAKPAASGLIAVGAGALELALSPLALLGVRLLRELQGPIYPFSGSSDFRVEADRSVQRAIRLANETTVNAPTSELVYATTTLEQRDGASSRVRKTESIARGMGRWMAREALFDTQETIASKLNVTHKRWISERDPRVRDSHRMLDGQIIRYDDTFLTQFGRLRYPGDITGPFNETINCRCHLEWITK